MASPLPPQVTQQVAPPDELPSAVPALKVMRLQSPEIGQPSAGVIGNRSLIGSALALPDSFGTIHIGETFTAYLGALNVSTDLPVRHLTVSAQLQTPTKRFPLPSHLDSNDIPGGVDVAPGAGVDTIVSRTLEEVGQHILRVEVGYGSDGGKSLRKFYRFNVASPLNVRELTMRSGDASCFVSIAVENAAAPGSHAGLTISSVEFQTPPGLVAERIGALSAIGGKSENADAVDVFDSSGRLEPGASFRYLFLVQAAGGNASMKGIACGDELGKAVFMWRKAMGETGRIASTAVVCPQSQPAGIKEHKDLPLLLSDSTSAFVVHRSGLSVDVAAAAANQAALHAPDIGGPAPFLNEALPVTVEPIDPPSRMDLGRPQDVQLLIVNHSDRSMSLQLQMRASQMSGVIVCGHSFKNLGDIPPNGGSTAQGIRLIPLVAGLLRVQGCFIVNLTTGQEVAQPPLFNVLVDQQVADQ